MGVKKACGNYFRGFDEIQNWKQNSWKQNTRVTLKVGSYFTVVPVVVVGGVYGTAKLSGRVSLFVASHLDRETYLKKKEASDKKKSEEAYRKGFKYMVGRGVEQDNIKSAKYYKKAASLGHADANYHLGAMYEDGRGGEVNREMAAVCYKRAAKTLPIAQRALEAL